MYTISSLTALILAICVSQSQAYITTGECIDSPVIKDFQVSQYGGKWYEIERAGPLFEYILECVTATYECIDGCKTVSVLNTGLTPIGSYRFNVTGVATARPDAPNQLDVNFDNGSTGVYNVWETDYKTYALVYSCKETVNVGELISFKKENAWILSRSKTLDSALVLSLKAKLEAAGVMTSKMSSLDQSCDE